MQEPNRTTSKDAARYRKLRRWMSSNVEEGWSQVVQLAAIACYVSWEDFDKSLDDLPECTYGLCGSDPLEGQTADHDSRGQAVAWQVRRRGQHGSWETCTEDLYERTRATGRYNAYENGPDYEARALYR